MQFATITEVDIPEEVLSKLELGPKRSYIRREPAVGFDKFIDDIVRPIMEQVAAKNVKKNLGMTVSALCGCIDFLPIHEDYTGSTNPFQTFSSTLTRKLLQPAYDGGSQTKAQKILPAEISLDNTIIPVYPQLTAERGVSQKMINRFINLCNKYNVDHTIFTETGGEIALTKNFLTVVSYWASDQGLQAEDHVWGAIKPMKYVPTKWLDEADIPTHIRNRVPGRKPGRPRTRITE
jgi:hypothetical protein